MSAHHDALVPGRYLVLLYRYVDDMAARRGPSRPAHLAHITAALDAGDLVNAGALGEAADRGLLVFADGDPARVEAFVAADPYQAAGLIRSWEIAPWQVVA